MKDKAKKSSVQTEIDYSPKPYTLQEQIIYALKFLAVGGIIFLLFWLKEKFL